MKKRVIIGVCTAAILAILFFAPPAFITKTINGVNAVVTLEQFNTIEPGMKYSEVCEVFGDDGSIVSEANFGNPATAARVIKWVGNGMLGSNCIVTFQGVEVVSKAQSGLR